MSTIIADAPARSASELPGRTHQAGHSEAMIVASIIAERGGPLGGFALIGDDNIRAVVERALGKHSHAHLLAWRQRIDPGMWSVRWDKARELVGRLYDTLPGAQQLPDVYRAEFGPDLPS